MKSKIILVAMAIALFFASCGTTTTVPVTGRKQTISSNTSEILSLSKQQYDEYLKKTPKSTNTANTQMVQRVGKRLATAVETYLKNNGYASTVSEFSWEFNLVQDKNVNAFCMPGGKIIVYEGLLPVTKDETSLAIVLGHEIAHAVAHHAQEQMQKKQNQQVAGQLGGAILGAVLGSGVSNVATQIYSGATAYANLKYSRKDESEADYMGLIFAALAGYDPAQAVPFWQRMASSSKSNVPEYLSDHPSDATRIADIQKELPEAQKYYQAYLAAHKTTTTKKTTTTRKKTTSIPQPPIRSVIRCQDIVRHSDFLTKGRCC